MPITCQSHAHHGEELPEEVQQRQEHLLLPVSVAVRHVPAQDAQHVRHGSLEEAGTPGGQVTQADVREAVGGWGEGSAEEGCDNKDNVCYSQGLPWTSGMIATRILFLGLPTGQE